MKSEDLKAKSENLKWDIYQKFLERNYPITLSMLEKNLYNLNLVQKEVLEMHQDNFEVLPYFITLLLTTTDYNLAWKEYKYFLRNKNVSTFFIMNIFWEKFVKEIGNPIEVVDKNLKPEDVTILYEIYNLTNLFYIIYVEFKEDYLKKEGSYKDYYNFHENKKVPISSNILKLFSEIREKKPKDKETFESLFMENEAKINAEWR